MLNMPHYVINIYVNDKQIYHSRKNHMKIFMSDVSVYNTHLDFRHDFRRKKCVLYAENYGKYKLMVANYMMLIPL